MGRTSSRQAKDRGSGRSRAVVAVAHVLVVAAVAGAGLLGGLPLPWSLALGLLPSLLAGLLPQNLLQSEGVPSPSSQHERRRGDAARLLALELSFDRVRSVLESLREGVFVVDGAGEVVLANPAARTTLRDPDALAVGELLWDVLPAGLAEAAQRAFAQASDEQPVRHPSVAVGERWFDLTAVRVHSNESGHDFGTAFLLVDVTRSHELAHLKDRFLSGISHELRTPLTNICAYAEILRTMLPGESMEWPEFVRIVHDEAFALSRLVDAVFDYAQLESGEAKFSLARIDAAEVLREAVAAAKQRAEEAGIDLACEVADGAFVEADRKRLLQVCAQLVDNALKFTPKGGAVRAAVAIEDSIARLSVDDSGPGVEPSRRDEVFEKFSQSRFQLTDKPSGAGIGLATCRVIVERLGGSIRVDPSVLGGASFVVELARVMGEVGGGDVESVGSAAAAAAVGAGVVVADPTAVEAAQPAASEDVEPAASEGAQPAASEDVEPAASEGAEAPVPVVAEPRDRSEESRSAQEALDELFGEAPDVHELASREDELVEIEWEEEGGGGEAGGEGSDSALAESEGDG